MMVGAPSSDQEQRSKSVKRGTTRSKRMRETADDGKRFNYINAPFEKKEKVVRAKMIPKGLFGCETSPANVSAMQKLRANIADTLAYVTDRRSTDLTFAVASGKTDLEPVSRCSHAGPLCAEESQEDPQRPKRWQMIS